MPAQAEEPPIKAESVLSLWNKQIKRTNDLFIANYGAKPPNDPVAKRIKMAVKLKDEYATVKDMPAPEKLGASKAMGQQAQLLLTGPEKMSAAAAQEKGDAAMSEATQAAVLQQLGAANPPTIGSTSSSLALVKAKATATLLGEQTTAAGTVTGLTRKAQRVAKPDWHAPWKLMRVISAHNGWVRSVAVDWSNDWFITGSVDRTIKVWDLASGDCKLTLTGHISAVRGLAISPRHPYMFSVSEDKTVRCWDLEQNKVIRSYHGHLSGVYSLALHPTLDVLLTGGRDSCVRVWDMRTKAQIHILGGHSNTVASICTQGTDPQVISGSMDATVKMWDLAAGKCVTTLTNHKKSVRAMTIHPEEYTLATASADNIKQWKFPRGEFLQNMSGQRAIVNAMAVNHDGVLASGADNGSIFFWDWKTGYNFHSTQTQVQPGSLDSEAGIFAMAYDMTGSRLITCEADKTVKIWKEDPDATPESNPIDWKGPVQGTQKRY